MEASLGIAGNGIVGSALVRAYLDHVPDLRVYDPVAELRMHDLADVLAADVVFACFDSPADPTESLVSPDLTAFLQEATGSDALIAIRSTVPPGFTRAARRSCNLPHLVHSPHLLTSRAAATDAHCPTRQIVGCGDTNESKMAAGALMSFYLERFSLMPVFISSFEESELTSLTASSFLATKLAFFQDLQAICKVFDAQFETVVAQVLSDGQIARSHIALAKDEDQPDRMVDVYQLLKSLDGKFAPSIVMATWAREGNS